jgi:hypothetical protein
LNIQAIFYKLITLTFGGRMGSARILGCAVNVESEGKSPKVTYTVSGEGAGKLHRICQMTGVSAGSLVGGSFTIARICSK